MTNNKNNDTAESGSWNSAHGLGFSVLQRHNKAFRHRGGDLVRNHLGRNRISLAADIVRRYHRNSSSISRYDFPLVNFFSQASLRTADGGGESLSQSAPLGVGSLHRMVDISPPKPHIGIKRGLMDVNMRRSSGSLAANEKSSTLVYPSKPSGQGSIVASNATVLSRMPHSSYLQTHISEQASVPGRTADIGEKPSLDNSSIAMDTNTIGGHLPGLVQRVVDRQSQKGFILNPAHESSVVGFASLEHYHADSKTAPMVDADSGVPAISRKAESSSEMIAQPEPIPSEAAQSGNNRSQSSVQRAVSRQNSLLSQNNYRSHGNNVFNSENSEPVRFAGKELWKSHAPDFASPLVTVNRKFSLSSGNRFEGLGLGRKIASRSEGTLSQQGFAADFIPESAIAGFVPLEHYYLDSKTASMADTGSGFPVISRKAESSSEMITRPELIPSEAAQSGDNRSQSPVQRAISRQSNVLSQNNYRAHDNNVFKSEPVRFASKELWKSHAPDFASPLVTVNRKFVLSSGNRFEGLVLGRKIAGRTEGTLSQQGFAADFIPESAIARFAPLEHYYADNKTASMVDTVSGVSAISRKAEPSSEMIAPEQQISSEAAQSGNNRSQSSVQRAINRQHNALSQKHYEPRDNNLFKGEPTGFAGNAPGTSHAPHFASASPLVTVNRKFALSSGNRFEGLGIGRKIADRTEGTLSQQGFAADFIPESAVANFAPLEHYNADSKSAPMVDAVSGVPAISPKAEPSSEMIAPEQQISSEAAQLGNNRSQNSVQRAINRQHNALSQKHYEPRDNNLFKGEPTGFAGNAFGTSHTPHFTVSRRFTLSSGNRFEGLGIGRKNTDRTTGTLSQQGFAADFIPASALARFAPLEHYNADSKTAPMIDAVSGVPAISPKAEPSSAMIARQEQIPSEVAVPQWDNRSQSSVQRAVERQNSIPIDRPSQPGIGDIGMDLKTNLRTIESGFKRYDSVRRSADIVSRSRENTRFYTADSLLMRSVVYSPTRVKPLFQVPLGRQLQETVSRKDGHGQRDMTVRHVEAGYFSPAMGNSFATVVGSLTSGKIQPATIEHGELARVSAMHLPLVLNSGIQRKTAVSAAQPVADDVSAYLQRQGVSNGSLETVLTAAPTRTGETVSTQAGKSESNSLSTDDVVDKVWRKLMRKLVSEQEKIGGSSRWA